MRHLVKSYEIAFRFNQPDKYNKIRDELTRIVSERIGATAMDIRNYASRLQAKKKFITSLLFHQVSIKFRDESDPIWGWISLENNRLMECIQKSLAGIYTTLINMPERVVFYEQITAIVSDLHDEIKNNDDLGPKTKAINQAWCLLTLGSMQLHCKTDLESSKVSFEDGLNLLSWSMDDADKHWIYGALCLGIADVYKSTDPDWRSKHYYQKAALAFKSAEDFSSDDEKKASIETAEKYI